MSKHEPLFKIESKYLYREQNLITVQVPVFFVCKDDSEQRYLVLLSDFDEDTYVVCPVSNVYLYNMLKGKIVMRQPFINADKIYFIQAGTVFSEDKVKLVSYDEIDDVLPEKDAKFEIGNNEILQSYALSLYCSITFSDDNRIVKVPVSLHSISDIQSTDALLRAAIIKNQKSKLAIHIMRKSKRINPHRQRKSINLIPVRNKK